MEMKSLLEMREDMENLIKTIELEQKKIDKSKSFWQLSDLFYNQTLHQTQIGLILLIELIALVERLDALEKIVKAENKTEEQK